MTLLCFQDFYPGFVQPAPVRVMCAYLVGESREKYKASFNIVVGQFSACVHGCYLHALKNLVEKSLGKL